MLVDLLARSRAQLLVLTGPLLVLTGPLLALTGSVVSGLFQKAVAFMSEVPKLCNDMMNLGRLQGYEVCLQRAPPSRFCPLTCPICALQGKLTSQGKLLQQETFFVSEQDAGVLSRCKERRVFLFEQIVIFSELLRKGSSTPGYQFKKSIKVRRVQDAASRAQDSSEVLSRLQVSNLGLEDTVDNDPCKFVLLCRGSAERFTLQTANVDIKQVWVQHIQNILDAQNNFLSGELAPSIAPAPRLKQGRCLAGPFSVEYLCHKHREHHLTLTRRTNI